MINHITLISYAYPGENFGYWPGVERSVQGIAKAFRKIYFSSIFKIILASIISILPSYIFRILITRIIFLSIITFYSIFAFCILISLSFYILLTKRIEILRISEVEFIEETLKNLPILGNFITFVISLYKRI